MLRRTLLATAFLFAFLAPTCAPVCAQTTPNDNEKVIALSKKGLDDDIVIARIKSSSWHFATEDDDLVALKRAGVSSKVVAAMLDASVITSAQVTIDGKPVVQQTLGQGKTGGRLGSALTYGIKSVKEKAFLNGPHAPVQAGVNPTILVHIPKGEAIENYIVVQMDKKDDRRELEVGSAGGLVGAKTGIRAEAIRKTTSSPAGDGTFKLTLAEPLKKGEYIVYVVGSADKIKEVFGKGYDFSVE